MKNKLLSAVMVCALGLVGCGEGETVTPPAAKKFDTAAKLLAHLEGKTMVMEGANIPAFPNGYNEDVSANGQCYNKVTMGVGGGIFTVTSDLATVREGACDHVKTGNPLKFTTTNVLIENVQGDGECFDVLFSYTGFAQEGRGKISADGKTLTLELFFKDQAVGIRCANGAVGSGSISVKGTAIPEGSAQQVYVIQ